MEKSRSLEEYFCFMYSATLNKYNIHDNLHDNPRSLVKDCEANMSLLELSPPPPPADPGGWYCFKKR